MSHYEGEAKDRSTGFIQIPAACQPMPFSPPYVSGADLDAQSGRASQMRSQHRRP